jgi:putative phosphoribosyl transferase
MMALLIHSERVRIQADEVEMDGVLWVPEGLNGVILFASGSGSNRLKPPYEYVGSVLHNAKFGTLWLDLLTPAEAPGYQACSDISLLTQRLERACAWLRTHELTRELPIGVFGSSNGTAAALQLAAVPEHGICAIVSRGGRPELAAQGTLGKVHAPTLLIVGGLEDEVVDANRAAYAALRCKKRLEIVPGATHAFDEPGSLEVVARLARTWFFRYAHAAPAAGKTRSAL